MTRDCGRRCCHHGEGPAICIRAEVKIIARCGKLLREHYYKTDLSVEPVLIMDSGPGLTASLKLGSLTGMSLVLDGHRLSECLCELLPIQTAGLTLPPFQELK